jgi:hypothetical protein
MPFDSPDHVPAYDLAILTDVRDRLADPQSWIKHAFKNGDRYCLVAALSLACGSRDFYIPNKMERRLARMLAEQLPSKAPIWAKIRLASARTRLMVFNDDSQTSHKDVVALVDRTIGCLIARLPNHVSA